ncbi:hypothetical protein F52700_3653 [Fusarium sp. NRRL 52700]|nr:hypothetical protein F52700_3653 [Fusarium sp. NRRL 52700]
MEPKPASGTQSASDTQLVGSTGLTVLELQELQCHFSSGIDCIDDENKAALNFSMGDGLTTLPIFQQEEPFTNPSTYTQEEAERCLQQAIDQWWADDRAEDRAAEQMNAGTNIQEQRSPDAPSATPDAKPTPRAAKRTREFEPLSRPAKRPAGRNHQPATTKAESTDSPKPREAKRPARRKRQREAVVRPRVYRPIKPRSPVPDVVQTCPIVPMAHEPHQQQFHDNRHMKYYVDRAALYGVPRHPGLYHNQMSGPGIPVQSPHHGPWQTRKGIEPRGVAVPYNGIINRPSHMVPYQQRQLPTPMSCPGMTLNPMPPQQLAHEMGMGNQLPSPTSSPGMVPNPMPPQQQLTHELAMGSHLPSPVSSPGMTTNPMPLKDPDAHCHPFL